MDESNESNFNNLFKVDDESVSSTPDDCESNKTNNSDNASQEFELNLDTPDGNSNDSGSSTFKHITSIVAREACQALFQLNEQNSDNADIYSFTQNIQYQHRSEIDHNYYGALPTWKTETPEPSFTKKHNKSSKRRFPKCEKACTLLGANWDNNVIIYENPATDTPDKVQHESIPLALSQCSDRSVIINDISNTTNGQLMPIESHDDDNSSDSPSLSNLELLSKICSERAAEFELMTDTDSCLTDDSCRCHYCHRPSRRLVKTVVDTINANDCVDHFIRIGMNQTSDVSRRLLASVNRILSGGHLTLTMDALLFHLIELGAVNDLRWINRSKRQFSMPWKHKSDRTLSGEDAKLFFFYSVFKGRDPFMITLMQQKAQFRNALNRNDRILLLSNKVAPAKSGRRPLRFYQFVTAGAGQDMSKVSNNLRMELLNMRANLIAQGKRATIDSVKAAVKATIDEIDVLISRHLLSSSRKCTKSIKMSKAKIFGTKQPLITWSCTNCGFLTYDALVSMKHSQVCTPDEFDADNRPHNETAKNIPTTVQDFDNVWMDQDSVQPLTISINEDIKPTNNVTIQSILKDSSTTKDLSILKDLARYYHQSEQPIIAAEEICMTSPPVIMVDSPEASNDGVRHTIAQLQLGQLQLDPMTHTSMVNENPMFNLDNFIIQPDEQDRLLLEDAIRSATNPSTDVPVKKSRKTPKKHKRKSKLPHTQTSESISRHDSWHTPQNTPTSSPYKRMKPEFNGITREKPPYRIIYPEDSSFLREIGLVTIDEAASLRNQPPKPPIYLDFRPAPFVPTPFVTRKSMRLSGTLMSLLRHKTGGDFDNLMNAEANRDPDNTHRRAALFKIDVSSYLGVRLHRHVARKAMTRKSTVIRNHEMFCRPLSESESLAESEKADPLSITSKLSAKGQKRRRRFSSQKQKDHRIELKNTLSVDSYNLSKQIQPCWVKLVRLEDNCQVHTDDSVVLSNDNDDDMNTSEIMNKIDTDIGDQDDQLPTTSNVCDRELSPTNTNDNKQLPTNTNDGNDQSQSPTVNAPLPAKHFYTSPSLYRHKFHRFSAPGIKSYIRRTRRRMLGSTKFVHHRRHISARI